MELRELRYFVALAEERNFTRAAARCFITQPAFSRAIAKLERQAGGPLFERFTSGVVLTAAGAQLLPQARRLLDQAAALVHGASEGVEEPGTSHRSRRFVVGLHDCGLGPLTGPLLVAFRAAHPDVVVQVRQVLYPELDTSLTTGEVDVLLTTSGSTRPDDSAFEALFADAMLAAVPAASPLADVSALDVDDVLDLAIPANGPVPEALVAPFVLAGHRNGEQAQVVNAPPPVTHVDLMLQVAHQDAFVALPATEAAASADGVAFVPLPGVARLETGVAVARTSEARPLVTAFRRLARATTTDLVGLLPDAERVGRSGGDEDSIGCQIRPSR